MVPMQTDITYWACKLRRFAKNPAGHTRIFRTSWSGICNAERGGEAFCRHLVRRAGSVIDGARSCIPRHIVFAQQCHAIDIAVDAMRVLACKAGWAQWFDPTILRNNDIAWTRGMGWAVLGLLDLVHLLDGRGTGEASDLAGQVLERLAQTQGSDGHWAAVLDHPPAVAETSTATFLRRCRVASGSTRARISARRGFGARDRGLQKGAGRQRHLHRRDRRRAAELGHQDFEHCPTEPSPWAQGAALRAFAAMTRAT